MILSWLALLLISLNSNAHADLKVRALLTPEQLHVVGDEPMSVGQRVVVLSEHRKQPIGYGEVVRVDDDTANTSAVVRVRIHEQNAMVMPGDRIYVPDLSEPSELIPGRIDLQLSGDRKYNARYKRLAYFGSMIGDGHTLEKNETLIDLFLIAQHGLTEKLTAFVVTPLFLSGVIHVGAKYKLIDNDFVVVTQSLTPGYSLSSGGAFLQSRTLITLPSNSKFQSHIAVSAFVDPNNLVSSSVNQGQSYVRTEIQSGYEYILDNWNRILVGPSYNLSQKTVGGYLAYMMIWDRFHLVLGVQTQNIVDIRFNAKSAYVPSFSMFWRF